MIRRLIKATAQQVIILLGLAGIPALLTVAFDWEWRTPAEFGELSAAQSEGEMEKLLWVDVRDPDRFEKAHVRGAVAFEEETPGPALDSLRERWMPGRRMIVYGEGAGSERAVRAGRLLKREFHTQNVLLLKGGWAAWPRERGVESTPQTESPQ
jgi:3-mercaptopyruvate sulfurtransferase SseA